MAYTNKLIDLLLEKAVDAPKATNYEEFYDKVWHRPALSVPLTVPDLDSCAQFVRIGKRIFERKMRDGLTALYAELYPAS